MKKMLGHSVFAVPLLIVVMLGFGCGDDTAQQNTDSTSATTTLQRHEVTTAEICKIYNLPLPTDANGNPVELLVPDKGKVITNTLQQVPKERSINTEQSNPNKLSKEDAEWLRKQGIDPTGATYADDNQPQVNGIAYMDRFLGATNFCIPSDNVISMKKELLIFQINGNTYDYAGHYAVMLNTPRKHNNSFFGFGTPEKAKLLIIEDFGGESMSLPDATIWEKSSGFIDAVALDKEWIYSGSYTIQN